MASISQGNLSRLDEIRSHHLDTRVETMFIGMYRGFIRNQGFLGGAGFRNHPRNGSKVTYARSPSSVLLLFVGGGFPY